MNYRNSRTIMWIGFIIGLLVGLISSSINQTWPMVVGTIIILMGIIQAYIFYRCPHCNKSLMDIRGAIPQHCPYCGELLQ